MSLIKKIFLRKNLISARIRFDYFLIMLAMLGGLTGLYLFIAFQKTIPSSQPFVSPIHPPFENFIFGVGIIETESENIEVGTLIEGVIENILVKKGDKVKKDQALFILDNRHALTDLQIKQSSLKFSKAALEEAKASLQAAINKFKFVSHIADQRAISKEDYITRQDNLTLARKNVENVKASVEVAEAELSQAQAITDFYIVKAPIDCEIMQINIHKGEQTSKKETPLMLVGNVKSYHIRVDIDEYDAWRFSKDEPAVAFLRGNPQYHTVLKLEYVEPYVVPKKFLTGGYTERVDTRVLQVVYSFNPKEMPAYLGQEVDVYIKSAKVPSNVSFGQPVPVK